MQEEIEKNNKDSTPQLLRWRGLVEAEAIT